MLLHELDVCNCANCIEERARYANHMQGAAVLGQGGVEASNSQIEDCPECGGNPNEGHTEDCEYCDPCSDCVLKQMSVPEGAACLECKHYKG